MNLLNVVNEVTMSSIDLRDLINAARKEFGEPIVENSHFLKRVEDELEGELGKRKRFVNPDGGRPMKYYDLTRDQCTLVGMRESKAVRRKVLEKLKELDQTPNLPAIQDPQLAAMVTMLTQLDQVKQEQESQKAELAELKAKITSTPTEYYTAAGYASLHGISLDNKQAIQLGRKAAKASREYGVYIGKAHSSQHGEVNTYHVDVLCEVFDN